MNRPIGPLILTALTMVLLPIALYASFFYAQVELRMGIVQKIYYFHVPSAYAMYLGFGLCALGSVVFLITRKDKWDALAVSAAEVGLVFCVIVLITGPLWARRAWGVWWEWDPRLTTTLLAGMIFTAYVVLRSFASGGEAERRFSAGLAIVGLFDIPIIHYSVKRWRGVHPTVGTDSTPEMLTALGIGFLLFTALAALLIWTRVRLERQRQELRALEIEAAERGLLEGS